MWGTLSKMEMWATGRSRLAGRKKAVRAGKPHPYARCGRYWLKATPLKGEPLIPVEVATSDRSPKLSIE